MFDAMLILLDTFQFIASLFVLSSGSIMENITLFRVVRLARITRILRLMRSDFFSDLLTMLTGMIGGMKTLLFAIGLFILMVYVVALIFRELLGRRETPVVYE